MASQRLFLSVIFTLCVVCAQARAQSPTPDAPPPQQQSTTTTTQHAQLAREAEEAREESERRAYLLLEEVIAEASSLKLAENRIRVQMTTATLLWQQDAERARAIFKEAQDSLVALINAADPADPQYQQTMPVVSQMRYEALNLLAGRDPQTALNFLRATRTPHAMNESYRGHAPDEESALELNLAGQIAAQDPKQALRLAEENLSKGVMNGLINVLQHLRAKDSEAARRLSGSIVQKLRTVDFRRDPEAAQVASNLLMLTRPNPAPASTGTTPAGAIVLESLTPAPVAIDEQARRELIDLVAGAVVNNGAGRMNQLLLKTLRDNMAEVERSAPTRVAALRRRMSEVDRQADPRAGAWREQQKLIETGTLESMLEAAPKASAEMREQLYGQAAWRAVGQGDYERARQIAGNLGSPQQRAYMLKEIERQMALRAIEEGKFGEVQQLLAGVTAVEERVPALLGLSRMAAGKGLDKETRAYLEEARLLIEGRAANQMQFGLKIQLAQAYATIEPERGFEMLEATIDHLNELVAAASTLNGFGQEAFKDGELRTQGGYVWSELISQCAAGLAILGRKDFDRARAATERFARLDTRVMARLVIAQNILGQHGVGASDRHSRPYMGGTRRMRPLIRQAPASRQ